MSKQSSVTRDGDSQRVPGRRCHNNIDGVADGGSTTTSAAFEMNIT